MYTGPNIITDGLVLALDAASPRSYPGSGTTWYDLSGNGNSTTLYNSPTYTNNNVHTFNFDESNDYAKVNNTGILPTTAYTKIAAFRPESSTANIISGGSDGQHAFWMGGTSTTLQSGHNGSWATVSYSPGDMLNQWWIGAVTFNTSTGWVLYLNGEQVDTSSSTTTFTNGNTVRIGAYYDAANLFDGDIANVFIYNRVLTATEIAQNYNAQKSRFELS
jgi:hypothetical protein